jgi:hypothetical protein
MKTYTDSELLQAAQELHARRRQNRQWAGIPDHPIRYLMERHPKPSNGSKSAATKSGENLAGANSPAWPQAQAFSMAWLR